MTRSRLSNSACNSSKVMTLSMYGRTRSFWNSAFLAVQGPMNTTREPGSVSLMYLEMVAAGERLCEMWPASEGKDFSM